MFIQLIRLQGGIGLQEAGGNNGVRQLYFADKPANGRNNSVRQLYFADKPANGRNNGVCIAISPTNLPTAAITAANPLGAV